MFSRIMPAESVFKRQLAMIHNIPVVNNKELKLQPVLSPVQREEKHQPAGRKRVIFTLGSPERVNTKETDEGFGVFLQACYLCKKKLKPDKDFYMYGHLRAFCSPRCRYQIALNGKYADDQEVDAIPITMVPTRSL